MYHLQLCWLKWLSFFHISFTLHSRSLWQITAPSMQYGTCIDCLPAHGEWSPSLDNIHGDGAVVVRMSLNSLSSLCLPIAGIIKECTRKRKEQKLHGKKTLRLVSKIKYFIVRTANRPNIGFCKTPQLSKIKNKKQKSIPCTESPSGWNADQTWGLRRVTTFQILRQSFSVFIILSSYSFPTSTCNFRLDSGLKPGECILFWPLSFTKSKPDNTISALRPIPQIALLCCNCCNFISCGRHQCKVYLENAVLSSRLPPGSSLYNPDII